MKDHPARLAIIGIGCAAIVGGALWLAYILTAGPVAPTATGGDATGIVAILVQIAGVVTAVLGFVADFKKAVPPEVIAAVRRMWDKKQIDVVEIIAIASGKYGKVDMNALFELIKKFQGELGPIFVPKEIDAPADATQPRNVTPRVPLNDEEITRRIMLECTQYKQRPVLVKVNVGTQSVVDLSIKSAVEGGAA